jgi:hypothetical protein
MRTSDSKRGYQSQGTTAAKYLFIVIKTTCRPVALGRCLYGQIIDRVITRGLIITAIGKDPGGDPLLVKWKYHSNPTSLVSADM